MYCLGVDLGGTNIVAGVVDENFNIVAKAKVKTNLPRPAEEIVKDMADVTLQAVKNAGLKMEDISYFGAGSPGSINPHTGMVATSNNLRFKNLPMTQMLKELTGVHFYIDNDANAAAYGEMIAGAGKGSKSFAAITLGTGVGGGVITDGNMLTGFDYAGGELGHTVMIMDGEDCTCGRKGCFEAYASATALIRQTKAKMQERKDSKMWELVEGNIDNVSGRTAFDAMRAGDEAAKQVVDTYCKYVACGATNIINVFRPEVFCIGGGISNEGETLLAPIREYVSKETYGRDNPQQPEIKAAKLANDAGIIGAAFLWQLYSK